MRKLLLAVIALLLLLPGPAFPQCQVIRHGIVAGGGGGECTTQTDQQAGTSEDLGYVSVGRYDGTQWAGTGFTAAGSSTYTVCRAVLRLHTTGSPTHNLQVCIYSNNAGVPDAQVGTCSTNTVAESSIGATEQDVEFTGISATITNSTAYFVIVKDLSGSPNSTNYTIWDNPSTYVANNTQATNDSPVSWATMASRRAKFTLYSE